MATTPEQRRILMVHLIRDLDTIRSACPRLTDELWNPQTETFELVAWSIARDKYNETGELVPRPFFSAEMKRRLSSDFSFVGLTEQTIDIAIATLYKYEAAALSYAMVSPILQDFLVTRVTAKDVQGLLDPSADRADVINRMWAVVQQSTISAVKEEDLDALGIDVFGGMNRTETGCRPIDELMGGIRLDECIGLLGPMKGGKTSLCQSLACDWIKQKKGNRVAFFSYEENTAAQWPKFLIAWMNRWHRNKVEGRRLQSMEPDLASDLLNAKTQLAAGLTLVDMSGTKGQGHGGPDELVATIENFYRIGKLGEIVIVDHARPLLMSWMSSQGMDAAKQMRFEVSNLCNKFKEVTSRFNVAGVLAHQMDAKGNINPQRVPSHMESSECKMFPEMFNHVICLGVRDKRHNVAHFTLSASRSLAPTGIKVKIAGWKCRVDVAEGYAVDAKGDGFLSPEEYKDGKVSAGEDPSKRGGGPHADPNAVLPAMEVSEYG